MIAAQWTSNRRSFMPPPDECPLCPTGKGKGTRTRTKMTWEHYTRLMDEVRAVARDLNQRIVAFRRFPSGPPVFEAPSAASLDRARRGGGPDRRVDTDPPA